MSQDLSAFTQLALPASMVLVVAMMVWNNCRLRARIKGLESRPDAIVKTALYVIETRDFSGEWRAWAGAADLDKAEMMRLTVVEQRGYLKALGMHEGLENVRIVPASYVQACRHLPEARVVKALRS